MRTRNALTFVGLMATLALAGCSTTRSETAEAAPVVAPVAQMQTVQIFDDSAYAKV